jgi:hypothetical protein
MVFKNSVELERFMLDKCKKAVANLENKIYAIIKSTLAQFYQEFTPEAYIRTNQLLHSLVKSEVKKVGNGYEAEVYFDASLLDYEHGWMDVKGDGSWYGYSNWDTDTILDVVMTGSYSGLPHGGWVEGTAIWTVSRERLGNIFAKLEYELRLQGIPIKRA